VTGHGVSSALVTAAAMAVVHTLESKFKDTRIDWTDTHMLHDLNYVIREIGRDHLLMTFFICEIDINSGHISYANAGHNPPFMVLHSQNDAIYELPETHSAISQAAVRQWTKNLMGTGNRLGYAQEPVFAQKTSALEYENFLILYTDGLIEFKNKEKEEYGLTRLKQICIQNSPRSAKEVCDGIMNDFDLFRENRELHDDVSLVVLKRISL